ncbi:hypothetical protein [Novispirillum itersonii]|uniref:hypothetical protein n=1 Tax=Novispirillum itersonii TaxID=189 RepID=UPI0012DD8260|nr:hypothetical protein [Novispirillum itersonii]
MMTDLASSPFRPSTTLRRLLPLALTLGAAACTTAEPPSPPPVQPLPGRDRAVEALRPFGTPDLYVVYDRDAAGLPQRIRLTTPDAGTALAPFLTEAPASRDLDCLRLISSTDGVQATVCHAALWQDRAEQGLSYLAAPTAPLTLTRLADGTWAQMRQAVSGLNGIADTATENSQAPEMGAAPPSPLLQAACGVIRLLHHEYAGNRSAALSGDLRQAMAFLQAYPGLDAADREAVAGATLLHTVTRPTQSAGEIRRVLRVLPLTAAQKAQGLDALRRLLTVDGWLSALRLGGTPADLQQARTAAAGTPGRHDDRAVEESEALEQALHAPGATENLFVLTAPDDWATTPGQATGLGQGTTVLSGPVTVAARPAARLQTGTYAVTVRIAASGLYRYSRRTAKGEDIQATVRSGTETEVVFTLSPPLFRQTQTVTLPALAAAERPEGPVPEVHLNIQAIDPLF